MFLTGLIMFLIGYVFSDDDEGCATVILGLGGMLLMAISLGILIWRWLP